MQHGIETKGAVAILTENADYFAMLKHILSTEGTRAVLCDRNEIGDKVAQPDIVGLILDVDRDHHGAAIICQRIKSCDKTEKLPVLAIIPNGDTEAYMELMRAGADQCLIRPFWPPHLLGFLEGINVRQQPVATTSQNASLKLGEIELWPERKRVSVSGIELTLGPIEFKLLEHLLTAPGRVFSRDELITAAWPHEVYVQPRTVDVHIGRIRRHLKKAAGFDIIRTARSSGYAIDLAA
ncbi:winged helix-turn-helix transcriptional regulator [Agrobacterium sp. 22-3674b3]